MRSPVCTVQTRRLPSVKPLAEFGSNAVELYVYRLRKQLAEGGADVEIHTIRGVGYLIAERAR